VLSSALRPETDRLIGRLARRYELALLSGDNERERDRFRALFGDDARLRFNQSPLDKLGFIRRLQESRRMVMMVGDGLNDAGALKQSDVGVAVVESVGAFSPASDVILAASCVPRLGEVLDLSCRVARIVWWSIGISALYNVLGVSIAATGVLSPVVCAFLMPLSSVCVVLFARRSHRLKDGHRPPGRLETGCLNLNPPVCAVRNCDLGFLQFEVQTRKSPTEGRITSSWRA
jgi:Cu+-exporting ATPase